MTDMQISTDSTKRRDIPDRSFVAAIERGLSVMRAFRNQSDRMTLSDVARLVSLPRATVRRCLLTLQSLGYVESQGRYFSLSPQVLTLARKICIVTDPVYSYRRDERRPPSSERKLRDFLKHIEMVKATYLPAHARCWEKYGPFALGDLEILTRKSRVAPEIKEEITRGIESLRETA